MKVSQATDLSQQERRTKATIVVSVLFKSLLCPMVAPSPIGKWLPQNWPPGQPVQKVWPHSVSVPISLELITPLRLRASSVAKQPEAKLKG